MGTTLRAHLLQPDLVWEDRAANFALIDRMLSGPSPVADVRDGDLVLLPEMFDSGFSFDTAKNADRDGATARFLAGLAEDLGCTVLGGRTVRNCTKTNCAATNRLTGFGAGEVYGGDKASEGAVLLCDYAKIHPFSFSGETDHFEGGDSVDRFVWRDGRGGEAVVMPAVCYDLRFPELFRLGALAGAEVMAIGANWPAARAGHWRALAIARAIENQAFVLACNRTGEDPNVGYAGGTIAVSPTGEVLGEMGDEVGALTVALDLDGLRDWRGKFPALADVRLIGSGGGGE